MFFNHLQFAIHPKFVAIIFENSHWSPITGIVHIYEEISSPSYFQLFRILFQKLLGIVFWGVSGLHSHLVVLNIFENDRMNIFPQQRVFSEVPP